ncbi:MAG: sulfatase [Pirellulaceae bacterium]
MSLSRFHIILLAVISIASIPSTRVASAEPRNIIIVLVDDLGWMDLGCQGSDFYQTPHIDQLAARGIRFINGYAACAVCSPTRAALMTGKDPARLGITDWIRAEFQLSGRQRPNCDVEGYHDANLKVLTPVNNSFLPHNEVTIAELLKQRGFVSCFIGKWHLGGEGYLPTDQGFDLNFGGWDYGQPPSYYDPFTNRRLQHGIPTLKPRETGEYLTDREADEAVSFIKAHKDRRFLLYLSHYAVHTPIQPKLTLLEKYQSLKDEMGQDNAAYATMVQSVDDSLGRIMATLNELELSDDTMIVFTSDNGGLDRNGSPTENAPLKSGKGFAPEGGIRVPWIIRWPGVTEAGVTSDEPVTSVDLFPTLAAAVGIDTTDMTLDGADLTPVLKGGSLRKRSLYWHFPHYRHRAGNDPYSIIRKGDFKLVRFYDPQKVELYHLDSDLAEEFDITDKKPAKVRLLTRELDKHLNKIGAKLPILK